jgi:hypothetical protein
MVTVGRIPRALASCAVAIALAGCASTSLLPGHGDSARGAGPNRPAADPAQVAVVRRWATALRSGDIEGAAKTFGLPSEFVNGGPQPVEIHTLAQAELVQTTLPCGAEVISAFRDGRRIDVLFRLVDRRGRGGGAQACGSGVGQTARTEFLIRNGHIAEWLRAPSLRGDPGVPTTPAAPTTPTTPGTATGPIV